MSMDVARVEPEAVLLRDDGVFPNSERPLLLYRSALDANATDVAELLQTTFAANHWVNSWRNGVYPFPHYHSTAHEVLGVFRGRAEVQLGGPKMGRTFELHAGDVVVIPAGVCHQNLGASPDFGVVGAYPRGQQWDLLRGAPGERPAADHAIARVPLPECDPLFGASGPLIRLWSH